MIKKLKTLYANLNKFSLERKDLLFLMKFAAYEDQWQKKIENLSKKNPKPFNSWFNGKSRIYLDFTPTGTINVPIDENVQDLLEAHDYFITDYVEGYCEKNGTKFRIGKIIQKLLNDELKPYSEKDNYEPNKDFFVTNIKRKYQEINNSFINSKYRTNKNYFNDLKVVISQDPHDLAKMSYERDWTSCMELGKGSRHEDLFCEVSSGGLIAYLVKGSDLEIEEPLARIHIRRLVGLDGTNLAKAEQAVYGNDVPGFEELVNAWVDNHNTSMFSSEGATPLGVYKLQGSEWSDTYQKAFIIPPAKKEALVDWFDGNLPNVSETKYVVVDNFFEELKEVGYETVSDEDDYNGETYFNSFEDAEKFKKQLMFRMDDDWVDYIIGVDSDFRNELEDDGNLDIEIERIKEQRFQVRVDTNDYEGQVKDKAVIDLVDKFGKSLGIDLAERVMNFMFKSSYYRFWNQVISIFDLYPETLNKHRFESLNLTHQGELINRLDLGEDEDVKDWLNLSVQKQMDNFFKYLPSNSWQRTLSKRSQAAQIVSEARSFSQSISSILKYGDTFDQFQNFLQNGVMKELESKLEGWSEDFKFYYQYEVTKMMYQIFYTLKMDDLNEKSYVKYLEMMLNYVDITKWEHDQDEAISIHDWLANVRRIGSRSEPFLFIIDEFVKNVKIDVEKNKMIETRKTQEITEEIDKRVRRLNATKDCIINNIYYSPTYKW
jgi:hypothetical protein